METAVTTIGISKKSAEIVHAIWLSRLNQGEKVNKKQLMELAIELLAEHEGAKKA